jgi:hypothetical protein
MQYIQHLFEATGLSPIERASGFVQEPRVPQHDSRQPDAEHRYPQLESTAHGQVFRTLGRDGFEHVKVCDKHGWAGGKLPSFELAAGDPCPFCRAEIEAIPGIGRYRAVQLMVRVQVSR